MAGTFAGAVGCSDTQGNSYTVDADITGVGRLFICSAHNVTALTSGDTITASYPRLQRDHNGQRQRVLGHFPDDPVDKISTNTGNSATPSSGFTATTTQANELLFGAIAHNSTPTFTPGSGYTLQVEVIGGSGAGQRTLSPEYQIVSATGTACPPPGRVSSAQQWRAAIVTDRAR